MLLQGKDVFPQEELVQPTKELRPLVLVILGAMETAREQAQLMHHVLQDYVQMHQQLLLPTVHVLLIRMDV